MTQGSRLMTAKEHVQRQLRAENVLTVERAGILKLNLLYTVNIKMEFRHPNYYKKLKASQEKKVISPDPATAGSGRAPSSKQQAPSSKQQASGNKPENND